MASNYQHEAGSSGQVDGKQRDHSSAEPPAGGRTDQHSIVTAAHKPVHGPGSTDHLAAAGGFDVPPGEEPVEDLTVEDPAASMIPGAREADTLTWREPGAIGGAFTGADIPPEPTAWLDERTARDRRLEGGGHYAIRDHRREERG
jgi:hypothetical protein